MFRSTFVWSVSFTLAQGGDWKSFSHVSSDIKLRVVIDLYQLDYVLCDSTTFIFFLFSIQFNHSSPLLQWRLLTSDETWNFTSKNDGKREQDEVEDSTARTPHSFSINHPSIRVLSCNNCENSSESSFDGRHVVVVIECFGNPNHSSRISSSLFNVQFLLVIGFSFI